MKKMLLFLILFGSGWSIMAQPFQSNPLTSNYQRQLKKITAGCGESVTATEIALNNVRALIQTGGDMWWDFKNAQYEIPKGSGKTALWNGGIWVGGTDVNGQLKLCAVRYRSRGVDFFTGPLITRGNSRGTTDIEVCYQYDRHWEVTRYQVDAFRNWYHADAEKRSIEYPGYTIPNVILNWPAHADASAGYDFYLAPFWDNNDDGYYNPADGDYPFYDLDGILPCGTSREHRRPRLFGDATLWWVYNDRGNLHQESGGEPIGMEFRAQAFEFSTNDALNDMSFYNYALINRSTYTLIETYFGCYVDGALGWAWDDFTGCHVSKGVGYFYNGETVDGSGEAWAYGASPPAIGIDFFEGPYHDPNGIDDCTSYDDQYKLICNECILNGNINGLNFGDGIVDNERWGMRRFVYYVNSSGVTGDPSTAPEYYNFLRGFWKDNERMRYGGNAHPAGGGDGPITDFMFPGESDPCGWGQGGIPMPFWSEETAGNEPYDRRMVQSSGPFVLEPGAINDITTGVVYARSYDGTPWASVTKMLQEDEKAQRLFENCFQVVDGPDAPELTIIEQDKKLIFHIWNKPTSNNYLEKYSERDPFIVCPLNDQDCNTNFEFQGYQVWQLKDHTVSITDATTHNSNLARVIFQCDLRDGISQIVNYEWNNEIEANQPVVEVEGANQGISHTFVVEEDLFATGIRTLVNFKEYYYLVVAYAYNSFKPYHQNDPDSNDGQKRPYLAGRRGAGGPIKTYPVIPHKVSPEEGGTLIRSDFGDSPAITRIEGHGTGRNIVDIDTLTHDAIMAGPPWKVDAITYQAGRSPINVTVADPLNLVNDNYTVRFDSVNYFVGSTMNGKVLSGKWLIHNSRGDTTFSESWISNNYDQLILDWGLAINITQEEIPYRYGSVNNGFLEATLEFEDSAEPWLWFIPDDDKSGPRNWIRAGYSGGDYSGDRDAIYEKILGGTWTTFKQAYIGNNGVANSDARSAID
ncbi:MAG: T9SS C-terminal target domain-containing protein, partial [Bacteroidetes bacterium]|nr:T9SS C-terminal target domain-containing protein [Bacteroidota bacterium]